MHDSSGSRIPRRLAGIAAALLILAAAVPAAAGEPASAQDGAPAHDPVVRPAHEFDPAAYRGKVLLVDFWASWCKPCAHSLPWLAELQARHGAEGLAVVAINIDSDLDKAADLLAQLSPGVEVFHDEDRALAADFDLDGMPSAYLFDRTGKRRAAHVGFLPAEAAAREQEIVELLAEGGTDEEGTGHAD